MKHLFNWSSALAALCMMKTQTNGTMNNWLIPVVGEFKKNGIPEDETTGLFKSFLTIKNREDRIKETESTIRESIKAKAAPTYFQKLSCTFRSRE